MLFLNLTYESRVKYAFAIFIIKYLDAQTEEYHMRLL